MTTWADVNFAWLRFMGARRNGAGVETFRRLFEEARLAYTAETGREWTGRNYRFVAFTDAELGRAA